MRKRLIFSTAVLACAGVVAMLADGTTVGASGAVPAESAYRMPSGTDVDPVLEWNQILNDTALSTVPAPNSLVTSRAAALVAAAVFDAVNGVDRRYKPFHVTARAPSRASGRAAAIQASYAMLIRLYPAHAGPLTTRRDTSIAVLGSAQAAPAGHAVGPGRRRQHLGSTAVRWVHTRNGAVHGICDAWLLAADTAGQPFGLRSAIRDDDAVGADTAVPVPSCAAPCAGKRRVRRGLQRNADVGGSNRISATTGRLRCGEVLERQRDPVLEPHRNSARRATSSEPGRERSSLRGAAHRDGGCLDCHLGCEVSVRLLASGDRDPFAGR